VIASPALTTVLIGMSTLRELETAAAAVGQGPLAATALDRLDALWREMAQEKA